MMDKQTADQLAEQITAELRHFDIKGDVVRSNGDERRGLNVWCGNRAAASSLAEALEAHNADGGVLKGVRWVVDGRLVIATR